MVQRKLRMGIIGVGNIGTVHLRAASQVEEVEVLAIADINEERLNKAKKDFNIPGAYSDYEKMIENEELDMISICTPNYLHCPMALKALDAKLHVLCEKPMALNYNEVLQMVEKAESVGKQIMPALCYRFVPQMAAAKKMIEEGTFGDIFYIEGSSIRRNGIPGMGSWFTQKRYSGGGALIDLGPHLLSVATWLIPGAKPIKAKCVSYDKFGKKGEASGSWGYVDPDGYFDVEDSIVALVSFDNGTTLLMRICWASNIPDEKMGILVQGEKCGGELYEGKIVDINGNEEQVNVAPADPYVGEIQGFCRAIINNTDAPVNARDVLTDMKIIDALYESAESKREVDIVF